MSSEQLSLGTGRTGGREATTGVIAGRYALAVGCPDSPPPTGWRWTKLSDVATLESGHTPSRRHPEYWNGDIPWIGIKDANDHHGRTIHDTVQHVTQLGLDNSSARLLPANTVCLSRTASIGFVTVMGRPMATSQDFVNWVCGPKIDHTFLKYVLLADRDALFRFAHGTTHQTIYFPEAKAFHVCLPPLEEQKRIAHILGTLDDKIELNRRMNATLEAMARALFQSWFVDFDPVRAKAAGQTPAGMDPATAALFPSEFEDSALGEIPKGWEVRSLDDCADYLNGLALQKYPAIDGEPSLPRLKIAELRKGNTDGAERSNTNLPDKYIVRDGDVIFSWSGSLLVRLWTGGRAALNQHLFKVTSDEFPRWFYYLWTQHHLDDFQATAAGKATTMGHIQRHHLSDAKVIVPSRAVIEAADKLIAPMHEQSVANDLQSRTLATLRDALLPKLLSGELRVGEDRDVNGASTRFTQSSQQEGTSKCD
jgi:type I restriction enzyme S subunit